MKKKRTLRQIFYREIEYYPGLEHSDRVAFLGSAEADDPYFEREITLEQAKAAMARSRARRAALSGT